MISKCTFKQQKRPVLRCNERIRKFDELSNAEGTVEDQIARFDFTEMYEDNFTRYRLYRSVCSMRDTRGCNGKSRNGLIAWDRERILSLQEDKSCNPIKIELTTIDDPGLVINHSSDDANYYIRKRFSVSILFQPCLRQYFDLTLQSFVRFVSEASPLMFQQSSLRPEIVNHR